MSRTKQVEETTQGVSQESQGGEGKGLPPAIELLCRELTLVRTLRFF